MVAYQNLEKICRDKLGKRFRGMNIIPTNDYGMNIVVLADEKGFAKLHISAADIASFDEMADLHIYMERGVTKLIERELQE